jgi:uncharacterized protein YeeX (DUF496 family)
MSFMLEMNIIYVTQGELSKLQVHRRKYKARFNANVHTIAEKLTDLDDRVTDLKSMSHLVEDVTHVDIPDLQSQVEALQEQMDTVTRIHDFPMPEAEILVDREDGKTSISALDDIVNGQFNKVMTALVFLTFHDGQR